MWSKAARNRFAFTRARKKRPDLRLNFSGKRGGAELVAAPFLCVDQRRRHMSQLNTANASQISKKLANWADCSGSWNSKSP